jgi:hypothetical protein
MASFLDSPFFSSSSNNSFDTDLSELELLIKDNALGCLIHTAFLAAGFFEAFLPCDATFLAYSGLFAFNYVPELSIVFFGLPHLAFFGCSVLVVDLLYDITRISAYYERVPQMTP